MGKLSENTRAASFEESIPPTILAPASAAPRLPAPAPQNMPKARIMRATDRSGSMSGCRCAGESAPRVRDDPALVADRETRRAVRSRSRPSRSHMLRRRAIHSGRAVRAPDDPSQCFRRTLSARTPVGTWQVDPTATMSMPEAPVNEHRHTALRENQIRRPWHLAQVRPKPVAQSMQRTSDEQFRLRVLAANPAHHSTALASSQDVSHLLVFVRRKVWSGTRTPRVDASRERPCGPARHTTVRVPRPG